MIGTAINGTDRCSNSFYEQPELDLIYLLSLILLLRVRYFFAERMMQLDYFTENMGDYRQEIQNCNNKWMSE
ncbi:MAG: hypothetical protein DI535_23155 [Citrobacter freundii]|nr:MAG: hypothetical protein DI535_23155 [Citrobacter freundii]